MEKEKKYIEVWPAFNDGGDGGYSVTIYPSKAARDKDVNEYTAEEAEKIINS